MIEVQHLNKTFRQKGGQVEALQDVSLCIPDGSIYGVIGYSGAGKSTLLRYLNLLEYPDSGKIRIGGFGEITLIHGKPYVGRRKNHPAESAGADAEPGSAAELTEPTELNDPVEKAVQADGPSLRKMTARQQNTLRRGIGMIFQHFNLLDQIGRAHV